jgi:hypothetical protein
MGDEQVFAAMQRRRLAGRLQGHGIDTAIQNMTCWLPRRRRPASRNGTWRRQRYDEQSGREIDRKSG